MRRAWFVSALVVLLVAPFHAGAEETPARFAVGFHGLPPGLHVGDRFHGGRIVAVNEALRVVSVVATDPAGFQERARSEAGVRYVEPVPQIAFLQFVPDDPGYATQYGPQQVGAHFAWDRTLGSTSVDLCVADTGVRYTHEDLADRYTSGHDYVNNDSDPWDDHGHGTHVSGIAAATTDNAKGIAGLARVSLSHAKVLDATGHGSWDVIANGITGCVDAGAHVVSVSIGGETGATVLEDAVNYAWDHGAVVVAAAGNGGPCGDCVEYPAKYANAIAVGCTNALKGLCPFSSSGPEVDLVAPGTNVESTWFTADTAYRFASGTSMSTPHVAGVAALLKSWSPTLTNADLRSALEAQAEDLGAAGPDDDFGSGLVRADRVLGAPQTYTGRLLAGTAGVAVPCSPDLCPTFGSIGYGGLSAMRFDILPASGRAYALTTSGTYGHADADVCWRDADDQPVGPCALNPFLPDVGAVPVGAVKAEVRLTVGADATYVLTIDP
jgi:thermitase